jgi:ParB family chromosome partitioning protein
MAKEAERLLEGTSWLPEPLRLVDAEPTADPAGEVESEAEALPAFLAVDGASGTDEPHAIAAE